MLQSTECTFWVRNQSENNRRSSRISESVKRCSSDGRESRCRSLEGMRKDAQKDIRECRKECIRSSGFFCVPLQSGLLCKPPPSTHECGGSVKRLDRNARPSLRDRKGALALTLVQSPRTDHGTEDLNQSGRIKWSAKRVVTSIAGASCTETCSKGFRG